MLCRYCSSEIDNDRAQFILEFGRSNICIGCSTEKRTIGFMDWGHKTAPQLVMCPANANETKRILNRANRRAR